MTQKDQRKLAKQFATFWKDKGYEKGQSQIFWIQLLTQVYGIDNIENFIEFEDQVHIDKSTGFIDAYIPSTKILIEQKSIDKDLRKGIKQSDGSLLNPFQQAKKYITEFSSENRRYIPMCFMPEGMVYTNALFFVDNATIYTFGILTSNVHNAWMRTVAGRLKSDYRYSNTMVYNTFPWPTINDEHRKRIEHTAQVILDVRSKYENSSLADLYNELTMPPELRKAHQENDKAVMEAYGFDWRT